MIKAVLFDLDETLLTRAAAIRAFIGDQYDRHRSGLAGIDRDAFIARFLALEDTGHIAKSIVYPELTAELGITRVSADDLLADYMAVYPQHVMLSAGALETLVALRARGLATGIITNGSGVLQNGKIDATGLRPLVDIVLISELEGVAKPDRAIFDRAAMRLGITPQEAMFVGDNPEVDILGAKAAGMLAVWYHSSTEWLGGATPSERTITALAEVIALSGLSP